ncbi:MAG: PEP-CTERM sorting domain-containing protein [Pseudomonadota bacterium]
MPHKMMKKYVLATILLGAMAGANAADWKLTSLGFHSASIQKLTNRGDLISRTGGWPGETYSVYYHDGKLEQLGPIPEDDDFGYLAGGVNEAGVIVGGAGMRGAAPGVGIVFRDGKQESIGSKMTFGVGINNSGQIVGRHFGGNSVDGYSTRSYLYSNGVDTDLGGFGGSDTVAQSINDAGTVVGRASRADGSRAGFVYRDGKLSEFATVPGFSNVQGLSFINNRDMMTGYGGLAGAPDKYIEFLYDHGKVTNLEALVDAYSGEPVYEFTVTGMNNLGQVVGHNGAFHSYLISDGKVTDLAPYGITHVGGINDAGVIAGLDWNFKVSLLQLNISPVPEPATYGMLLGGLGLFALARRRPS